MLTAVVVTLAFFPVYLYLRAPYVRLPLHIDTGFYVSNHAVCTGRFKFARGWNAHYAGCSKALPEWLYTMAYLHTRKHGHSDYGTNARRVASCFNFASAITVGIAASVLHQGDSAYYYTGLILFALLSSEPRYGVYFECGELFELPFQIASVTLLIAGTATGAHGLVALAAALWVGECCFIKLSSLIAFPILFGAAMVLYPWTVPSIALGAGFAAAAFVLWMVWQGQSPGSLIAGLVGHEANFGQRADLGMIAHRLREKLLRIVRTIAALPIIPAMAVAGVLVAPPEHALFWAYVAAVFAVYCFQATDCWYYLIPLTPPVSLLAACGTVALASAAVLWFLAAIAAAIWLNRNFLGALRLDADGLNKTVWRESAAHDVATRNAELERFVARTGDDVRQGSLLVYGPLNQAYVLYNTSYPTPIVAPEHYLDDVAPGWQTALNTQLVADPPTFVLDTGDCFDAQVARIALGLDYRLENESSPRLRLFKLHRRTQPAGAIEDVRTFALQTVRHRRRERAFAHRPVTEQASEGTARAESPQAARLRHLLQTLVARGHRRAALYGAGRFTLRHIDVYRDAPLPIAVVLDDRPEKHGPRFLDWPIATPDRLGNFDADCLIVSSDRFGGEMARRIKKTLTQPLPIYRADRPPPSVTPVDESAPRTPAATPALT